MGIVAPLGCAGAGISGGKPGLGAAASIRRFCCGVAPALVFYSFEQGCNWQTSYSPLSRLVCFLDCLLDCLLDSSNRVLGATSNLLFAVRSSNPFHDTWDDFGEEHQWRWAASSCTAPSTVHPCASPCRQAVMQGAAVGRQAAC